MNEDHSFALTAELEKTKEEAEALRGELRTLGAAYEENQGFLESLNVKYATVQVRCVPLLTATPTVTRTATSRVRDGAGASAPS